MGNMENRTCEGTLPLANKFKKSTDDLKKLKVTVASLAKDGEERLHRVALGKEIIARGQEDTELNREAVRTLRSKLNLALPECAKLDEQSGVFDKQVEQRVAQFQARHLGERGKSAVDGIVGKQTYNKLEVVIERNNHKNAQVQTAGKVAGAHDSLPAQPSGDGAKSVRSLEDVRDEDKVWAELDKAKK